jgi:signal peptidase II
VLAGAALAAALAADLSVKHLFLSEAWNSRVLVPGLLETHYAWNRGVSFSLFWQSGSLGSGLLAALLLAVVLGFAVAAFRTAKPLVAAGLGLIVGGALGNLADRYVHGAVFDFLVVRLGAHPLFVCNSADIFISLGVLCLAADMLRAEPKRPQSSS